MFEKEGEKEKVTNRKKERERKTKGIMIRAKDLQREKRGHVRGDQERNVRQ